MSFRAEAAAMRSTVQKWRGEAARYTRAEGAALICTAIIRTMDYVSSFDGLPIKQTGTFAILLVSEIGACPGKSDTIELLDASGFVTETYVAAEAGTSEDTDRLEWRVRVTGPS